MMKIDVHSQKKGYKSVCFKVQVAVTWVQFCNLVVAFNRGVKSRGQESHSKIPGVKLTMLGVYMAPSYRVLKVTLKRC